MPADFDPTDAILRHQALRRPNASGLRLTGCGRPALIAGLIEGHHGVGVQRQALEPRVLPLPDPGRHRVGGDEGSRTALGAEHDKSCESGQFVTVGVDGWRAPAHDDTVGGRLVCDGRYVLWRTGPYPILALGPHADGGGPATLVAFRVEGDDGVEVSVRLFQARVFERRPVDGGDADEGVCCLFGAEHVIARQPRQLTAVNIALRHIPGDGDVAEVRQIRHGRQIPGSPRRHFVGLGFGTDDAGQFAGRPISAHGTDAIEEQRATGEIAVNVGSTAGGKAAAFGTLETYKTVVRLGGAKDVVADEVFVIHRPPGDDDAADLVGGANSLRCRQPGRRDLHCGSRAAGVSRFVESHHAVAVGGERSQPGVLKLADCRQQGVDRNGTTGAGLGAQDDEAGQAGQFAAIAVRLWRRPAQHDTTQNVLVRHGGQALRRFG